MIQKGKKIFKSALPDSQIQDINNTSRELNNPAGPAHPDAAAITKIVGRETYLKDKPESLILLQAAQIQRLTESLNDFKCKVRQFNKQQLDRNSYEVQIKQLFQNDNRNKLQIQKLNLSIKNLIDSSEGYRKQLIITHQKISELQTSNRVFIQNYQTITIQKNSLNQEYGKYRKQSEENYVNIQRELILSKAYTQNLKSNNQDLLKRVNTIPDYEKRIFELEMTNSLFKSQSQRLNQIIVKSNEKIYNLQKNHSLVLQKANQIQKSHKNLRIQHYQVQVKLKNTIKQKDKLLSHVQNQQQNIVSSQGANESQLKKISELQQNRIRQRIQSNRLQSALQQKLRSIQNIKRQYAQYKQRTIKEQEKLKKYYESQILKLKDSSSSQSKIINNILEEERQKTKYFKLLLQKRQLQNIEYQKKIKILQAQINNINISILNCSVDKNKAEKQNTKWVQKLKQQDKNIQIVQMTLKAKNDQNQAKVNKISQLQILLKQQISKCQKTYETVRLLNDKITKLNQQNKSLQKQNNSLKNSGRNHQAKLNQQIAKNNALALQFNKTKLDLQEKLRLNQRKISQLQSANANHSIQSQNLNKMIINKVSESQSLKKKMLTVEKQQRQQFENNLTQQKKIYDSKIEIYQNERNQRNSLLTEHKQATFKFISELANHKNNIQQLKVSHESLQQANNEYIKTLQQKQNAQKKLKSQIILKNIIINRLQQQIKSLTDKNINANQTNKKLQQLNSRLNRSFQSLELQKQERLNQIKLLTDQRNQISRLLENKITQNEKLKRKLFDVQDNLRVDFQNSISQIYQKSKTDLQRAQHQRDQVKANLTLTNILLQTLKRQSITKQAQFEKTSQILHAKYTDSENSLKNLTQQRDRLLQENQDLTNKLKQFDIKIGEVFKEMERLHQVLASSEQKYKQQINSHSANKVLLQQKISSLEQEAVSKEALHQQNLGQSKILLLRINSFQQTISRLQSQFISIQLLTSQLKQERDLLLKKNNALIKGVHHLNHELKILNEESDRIHTFFTKDFSVHQDLGKHYKVIHEIFNSLQKQTLVQQTVVKIQTTVNN